MDQYDGRLDAARDGDPWRRSDVARLERALKPLPSTPLTLAEMRAISTHHRTRTRPDSEKSWAELFTEIERDRQRKDFFVAGSLLALLALLGGTVLILLASSGWWWLGLACVLVAGLGLLGLLIGWGDDPTESP